MTIFITDLTNLITKWVSEGANVILAIDANQNVYSCLLAKKLAEHPINMNCAVEKTIGERVPNSHHRGTTPISTVFSTPGITPQNAMVYPHWYNLRDHRVFIIKLDAYGLFGGLYPRIAPPSL